MNQVPLPGLVGEVEAYFRGLPIEVDLRIARGAAISVMAAVARGRCMVRAPAIIGTDNGDLPPSTDRLPVVGLVGSSWKDLVDARERLLALAEVKSKEGRLVLCREPPGPSDALLVTMEGLMVRGAGTDSLPPPALIDQLRTISESPCARFVVKMNWLASEDYVETGRAWLKEGLALGDLGAFDQRVRRWTSVAGLFALGAGRVITGEILRTARHIANEQHEAAAETLAAMPDFKRALAAQNSVPRIH